ncbi:hypothetical protein EMIT0P176_130075 [Pseudomonas sp. IT-P176]
MGFAVFADKTIWSHQNAGVEESHAVAFGETGHEVNVVLAGEVDPALHAWPVRNRFGMGEGILSIAEEIAGIGKFGQNDEIRTSVYRFKRQFQAATQITYTFFDADLWIELHDCYTNRACWLIHFRRSSFYCFSSC